MLLNGCGSGNNRVLEEVSEKVYAVEPSANISIHNYDGAILVYGSDVNEVRVRSLKKAYSHERLNQIAIDVSAKPGAVSITAKVPPQPKWAFSDHSGTVDCTIVVPATASISALDLNAGEVLLDSYARTRSTCTIGRRPDFRPELFHKPGSYSEPRHTHARPTNGGNRKNFRRRQTSDRETPGFGCPAKQRFHLLARAAHGKIANDFNNVPLTANSSARR